MTYLSALSRCVHDQALYKSTFTLPYLTNSVTERASGEQSLGSLTTNWYNSPCCEVERSGLSMASFQSPVYQ